VLEENFAENNDQVVESQICLAKGWSQRKGPSRLLRKAGQYFNWQRPRHFPCQREQYYSNQARLLGKLVRIYIASKSYYLSLLRDSYHNNGDHRSEISNPFPHASRGLMRYDPHSRRYRYWYLPEDWWGMNIGPNNEQSYPRFTEEEGRRILRRLNQGRQVDPLKMGKEWNFQGPKV
jgi:hypothetical protein